ncbi:uncharacterized protein LOC135352082 isoform X2 [Halichondria panicea]|uniref:uncharacterized protein LOC135352082 isoform X2 n=1 Tax=Halichondria panicea TaxID=6063 RepID=UPI00312BA5AD
MATEQDSDAQKKLAEDLYWAVDVTKVRSLLGQGADPNHQLYWSDEWAEAPPLHCACWRGNLEIVKTLVTHGADKDARDKDNGTLLHYACMGGRILVVQYLVEVCKVDVDVTNDDGETPLDTAVWWEKTEVADYLKSLVSTPEPDTPNGSEQLPSTSSKDDSNLTSSTLNDESSKSEQALNDAMKAGFVPVSITNILLFGMAGTGKTSTKHLLLGLSPPVDRNSTPLASTAERICIQPNHHTTKEKMDSRQIRDCHTTKIQMEAQEDLWKPVTSDDLQRIVADAIKSRVTSEESAIPLELSIALKQLEPSNESSTPVDATPSTSRTTKPSVAGAEITREGKKSKFLKTVSNVMASIKRFSDADRTAVQEKFGSHWIYIIDSGGQPHFHNLLPLFMPKISVALYILRLSDCLDDHPLVEYYKDNEPVGEAFKSHLSVLDNFKYLVQSIQSHSENCKLVCIGTHKDHQSECKETLSDKNKTLFNFTQKDCIKNLTLFFKCRKKDVIFPVNCKKCDPDSKKVAKTIREYVHKLSQNLKIKVPFWWFVLEIIVEKVSNDEKRKVLSKTECEQIAKALHNFHEDALCEALKFFHEHHIFHYYPTILPNVVFCDTQVLLDKVTELVEYAAYMRVSNDPGFGNLFDVFDKGIITIELLSEKNFEKHYIDGLFAPIDLIEIFKHLLIATPFGIFSRGQDKRFYMPSLLSLLPPTQVNDKRADLLKTGNLIPLVLHFKNNWQCCGVFCCLQVYLIKECEWEIDIDDHQPSRNFVQFFHRQENFFVTLIDGFSFLEIHSSTNRKDILSLINENVHSGLRSAYKALKYTYEDPEVAFLCPHELPSTEASPQVPHHPACVVAKGTSMTCTQRNRMTYKLEKGHKDWLSVCPSMSVASDASSQPSVLGSETSVEHPLASGQRNKKISKRPTTDITVQGIAVHDDQEDENQLYTKDLQEVVSQLMEAINVWFELGLALGIPVATLENIKCHTNHNKDGLIRMLTQWLESSPSRTWSDICNGLRSGTVRQDVLANTIEEKYDGRLSGKRKRQRNDSCVPRPHTEDSSRPPHITDPLAPGHRKRLLGSGEEGETLLKRPKKDVTVQGQLSGKRKRQRNDLYVPGPHTEDSFRPPHITDPLIPGHRKRLLGSDEEGETLLKRPKKDVTVQGSSQEEHTSRNQRSSIVLTGDDVLIICDSLNNASNDWFNLGLALGMKITDLEDIEDAYRHNQRRLMKMVGKRLQVTEPPMTWAYICECLRRPTVECNDVAEEIEDKYVRTATAVAHSATN